MLRKSYFVIGILSLPGLLADAPELIPVSPSEPYQELAVSYN